MASFDFDQAEGLRRMLAGPKPRIVTFLSAATAEEKCAMLTNLAASLVRAGEDVLLMDANPGGRGVSARLGLSQGMSLQNVARQECALDRVVKKMPQGFGVTTLARGPLRSARHEPDEATRLIRIFNILVKQSDIALIDAELDADDDLPMPALSTGEIVVQVSNSATSIKAAYCIIKRLNATLGRRAFGILVTGASEADAKLVYDNMAQAASRYLAVQLKSMGSVPADECLNRAERQGRSVIEAFPAAGASRAFRQLAGRFVLPGLPAYI